MTKRRRLVLASAAALAVSGVLLLPAVQWRLYGVWKGEAFDQGLPTAYYRPLCNPDHFRMSPLQTADPYEGWWLRRVLGARLTHQLFDPENPLRNGDPTSIPVLVELLRDADWEVRIGAVSYLAKIRPPAREALPALRRLLAEWGDADYYKPDLVEECVRAIENANSDK